ncbi:MAG: hypothetical protein U9P00_03545 [Pseudomonadota bacterium]|nr:hypothetical protein [Pseudomonadota bacterium]
MTIPDLQHDGLSLTERRSQFGTVKMWREGTAYLLPPLSSVGASMTDPIDSGWSGCRVGPTENATFARRTPICDIRGSCLPVSVCHAD